LNGNKVWITNGSVADIYVVFAKTDADAKHRGISAFIVEAGTEGFTYGKKEKKLGIRSSSTTELIFENCRVPTENMLGKECECFKIDMTTLDVGRSGIAAQAVAIAQVHLDAAANTSKEHKQFGKLIE